MRKLRITSDGTSYGTRVVWADTGEPLELEINAVTWTTHIGSLSCTAEIIVRDVEIDAVAEAEVGQ